MQHRSPIIFWLLLAATVAVDAVVAVSIWRLAYPPTVYMTVAFYALIISQLSVVCIGCATRPAQTIPARAAPFVAALLAAIANMLVLPMPDNNAGKMFISFLGYYGLHCVLVLAALWLLQRTRYWSRRTDVVRTWQYSVLQILALMTIVAILVTLMRNSVIFGGSKLLNFVYAAINVLLAVASVFVWSLSWHWVLRLASILGTAFLLGVIFYAVSLVERNNYPSGLSILRMILAVYYLIQAIVLSVWLSWGQLIPDPKANVAADD